MFDQAPPHTEAQIAEIREFQRQLQVEAAAKDLWSSRLVAAQMLLDEQTILFKMKYAAEISFIRELLRTNSPKEDVKTCLKALLWKGEPLGRDIIMTLYPETILEELSPDGSNT